MLRTIFRTPRFKRDYKAVMRKHYDEAKFVAVLADLMADDKETLRRDWDDHELKGQWKGFRELHIEAGRSSLATLPRYRRAKMRPTLTCRAGEP